MITPSASNCKATREQGYRKRYPLTACNLICFRSKDTGSVTRFQRAINLVLEAMTLEAFPAYSGNYLKLEAKALEGLSAKNINIDIA